MTEFCVIYAAKSTTDRHLSIPEQLDDCREMARENGWEIVGEFQDEGFTAFTGNRGPGLAAAIELAKRTAAERGQAFIVAQHTSRFARGDGAKPNAPKALVELWHEWARANVQGRTVENDYAMQSSVAAATQGEADHSESKRKSKSVSKGLRRRARDRGKLAGGISPYGYRWVADGLEPVPAQVPIVRRIFDETIAGRSQLSIARSLNRDGIRPSRAERWCQSSVRRVLTNPVYFGKVRHDGELYDGIHEPILDEATFEAARRMSESKENRTPGRGAPPGTNRGGGREPKGRHIFTRGLLRCGTCGEAMTPRTLVGRTGKITEFYHCLGHHRDKEVCPQKPVRRQEIDEAMMNELDARFLDLNATRERYAARRAADARVAAETLAQAQTETLRVGERLSRVTRAFQDGYLEPADYAEQRRDLLAQQAAADAAVERARHRAEAVADEDVSDEVLERLRDLRAAVLGGVDRAPDVAAVRKVLRVLFETVWYGPTPDGPFLALEMSEAAFRPGSGTNEERTVRQPLDLEVSADAISNRVGLRM